MSELNSLILDLALILVCAGVMSLVFKKLKQPLVLGYIVAGFIASPHFGLIPSVGNIENIKTWADIGVIFLLFSLGLEFSFKKIIKMGFAPMIATLFIIFCMMFLGITVGSAFGWKKMDCIFLGGMIAMSSTTIIYKAFEDLGLLQKQFAGLVLSALIIEDILAIVLMVLLSTMAESNNIEGSGVLLSLLKLGFFLILWFVIGIYLIPLVLRWCRNLMNDETLLIVALALCFGMVVMVTKTGFSSALGAFIMGSILAETLEAEKIDRLVRPVKDLFGAIFFVSVGMMVDPAILTQYAFPILAIVLTILLGQAIFGSAGFLLSGQSLRTAIQCGFSMAQIGEFAFIIASLGVSLKVTSEFLYPIVVAVSVITTFLTPYMIKLAQPVGEKVERLMPKRWLQFIDRNISATKTANSESTWHRLLKSIVWPVLIYSIICVAIVILSFGFFVPFCHKMLPGTWGSVLAAVVTVLAMSPFLRAVVIKKNKSEEFNTLWHESRGNRLPLVAIMLLRVLLAVGFIMVVIAGLFKFSVGLLLGIAIILVFCIIMSRNLKKQSMLIERTFMQNLNMRENREEYLGKKQPRYAGRLLSRNLHLAEYEVPVDAEWVGEDLATLDFGRRYGVQVVSILRGKKRINIPNAKDRLFPQDRIQVIADDEDLDAFGKALAKSADDTPVQDYDRYEMVLRQFIIGIGSPFVGKTVKDSGIRNKYHCLIVGVEHRDGTFRAPEAEDVFVEGDVVWVVGEKGNVGRILSDSDLSRTEA